MKTLSGLRVSVQRGLLVVGQAIAHETYPGYFRRGIVDSFSDRSRARLGRYLRNSVCDYPIFGTLTYPPGYGQSPESAKRDLKCFLERVRRATCGSSTMPDKANDGLDWSVIWWMEFTESGRIHFHFCSTHRLPKDWLSRCWYEVVGSENEYHLKAGTRIEYLHGTREQTRSYAMKYAAKTEQKDVPAELDDPGRFWGVWGCRDTVEASTFVPDGALSQETVAESVNKFAETVTKLLENGDLHEQQSRDDNVKVYFFADAWVHSVLAARVEKIDLVSAPFGAAYMMQLREMLRNSGEGREKDPTEKLFANIWGSCLTSTGILDYADRLHSASEQV